MTLTTRTVLINIEDWDYLKSLNVNLSSEVRDFLRQLRSIKGGDIDGINIKLEQLKLQKNIEKMTKTQLEIKKSEEILQKHSQIQQKKQENELKKQKEDIEKQNKCASCGNLISEDNKVEIKANTFLCKACYQTRDIKKYL